MSGIGDFGIVYFGNDWFAETRNASHHIARHLAALSPVLYIETPGSRGPQLKARDIRKLGRKIVRSFAPPQKVAENLFLMTIPQVPFRRLPLVPSLNCLLSAAIARHAIRRLGFKRWISWFLVAHVGGLAKRLGEVATVYYCVDDYASYPGMDPIAIQALDDHITKLADVVFVTHRGLLEAKRLLNPNIHFSPHGVDFDLFSRAMDSRTEPAEETRGLKHPVIGYFGAIGEYVDFDLLDYLAKSRPEWTFLFVGWVAANVSRFHRYPNVLFVGPKPYESLPQWAKAFDVAIYAHRVNRQTRNSNPKKLREYLATGKPIVSVITPETACFSEHLYLAETPEAYLAAIERALAEDSPERSQRRMNSIAGVSWDSRFRETVAVVEEILNRCCLTEAARDSGGLDPGRPVRRLP